MGINDSSFVRDKLFSRDCRYDEGWVEFLLGAHHTGFKADASEIQGQLQKYISEIKDRHPESAFEQE